MGAFWGRTLRCHILRKHKDDIQNIALVDDEYIWDTYKEALAVQERQGVPAVGPAVDRRAFDTTLEVYNDSCIQALLCMCCARICFQTAGPRSASNYQEGKRLLQLPVGCKREEEITEKREERRDNI